MILLRGPGSPTSTLHGHSLLEDLYGSDSLSGVVRQVTVDAPSGLTTLKIAPNTPLSQLPFFYSGSVLTILDGPARGISKQVVTDSSGWLVVESYPNSIVPRAGDRFLLNGRPFNGTGTGFEPSTGTLEAKAKFTVDEEVKHLPLALLPHIKRYGADFLPDVPPNVGGADETWDAPDYQNLFLASPTVGIPSFHRPALIDYWRKNFPDLWKDPRFRRLVVLRPLPDDHPAFTGGNPQLSPGDTLDDHLVNGPWDVDNDNDGAADSVWIDMGFPVQSSTDGRLYKPLFAVLCVDLDSRINVNAHGNARHLTAKTPTLDIPLAGEPSLDQLNLPAGRGYGPADVSLDPIFGSEAIQLLRGDNVAVGRYGADQEPGVSGKSETLSAIDRLATQPPPGTALFPHSTDLFGTTQVALDPIGRPLAFSSALLPGSGIAINIRTSSMWSAAQIFAIRFFR